MNQTQNPQPFATKSNRQEKKSLSLQNVLLILVSGLLILVLCVGGLITVRLYGMPMAAPLTVQPAPTVVAADSVAKADPTATTAPSGICGQTGKMTLLFTGADFSGGNPPPGADAVRLVQYDFSAQSIHVVAFPRDLWVKTDGLKDLNTNHERLGLAYHVKKQAASGTDREKVLAGTNLLAQVLYDNFQLLPDHYMTLQLDSVQSMVNTIGGVEVTLPESITTERMVTFPAGTQTLNGQLSAEFLRAIQPGGDPARLKRQNLYVTALRSKTLSAGTITKVPDLLQQFNEAIVTDLSPSQVTAVACAMEKVPQESIKFYEIGGDMVTAQKDGSLLPVWGKIKPMLEEALGGKLK